MFQLIVTAALLSAAPLSQDVGDIVDAMAAHPTFGDRAVGYAGTKPPVYELYEELEAVAAFDELVGLLQHDAPVVRLYAFQALVARGYDGAAFKIGGADEVVATRYGCIGMRETVGDVAERIMTNTRLR